MRALEQLLRPETVDELPPWENRDAVDFARTRLGLRPRGISFRNPRPTPQNETTALRPSYGHNTDIPRTLYGQDTDGTWTSDETTGPARGAFSVGLDFGDLDATVDKSARQAGR